MKMVGRAGKGSRTTGHPMGVFTGLRGADGKMLWMVAPGRVSWHVACHCKKTRNMVNIPSLRSTLDSYIDVFHGGTKNLHCI